MAQRRFHYEQAFEHYLRSNGIPYVAVDEAKRALQGRAGDPAAKKLKSFDFVVYSESGAKPADRRQGPQTLAAQTQAHRQAGAQAV